ncbi:MAG: penicillin-binding protein [Pyrinomonadaceae bacterium]|jgi:penicillin-binding protein 1B|nr:penicillin-binding protein [Pyrinomonadaceae bacterium]
MTIEVTSISEPDYTHALRRHARRLRRWLRRSATTDRRLVCRFLCGVFALILVAGGDSLLRSYKYYSRLIDARLAAGYLTSRPGLYAAPRVLRAGQKLSRAGLIQTLRRAGYVESERSQVWNGSFRQTENGIEIRARRGTQSSSPDMVLVAWAAADKISEITADGVSLDSFTLEPEVLANDLSSKGAQREAVQYSDVPPLLVHAILATEDHRFFEHSGVDFFGIARALLRNAGDERLGQGGSTITQQLVKNTYLSPERTLQRKYAEAMLSLALERRLSKEDIFALYCNEVYLGQRGGVTVRGVKEGARVYFGKELPNLSLAEAATLAGMIQSPNRYSPLHHAAAAQARRNVVLDAMVRDGWIQPEQAAEIAPASVSITDASRDAGSLAPYFVDYVNRTGDPETAAANGPQRIYTTIDLDLQNLAEAALKRQLDQLDNGIRAGGARPQAALVALDPKTGNVLALVGGRDYAESQLNRATDARRQPGSTFKPFVYAAAIEDGMSPVQTFSDAPRQFTYDHDKLYRPANYGGGYSMSNVTMRTGLVKSLNVVTVDIALQTGLARIATLAERFGLPRPERYPSLALGTKEVTPLELAAAYAPFVNGGHRIEPRVIASLGEPNGTHLEANQPLGPEIISPTTAYMITNMLAAVVDHGTARAARGAIKGTAIAGKTGTSRDGWFVGYTPNLVCVVWIGFDDNEQLGLTGASAALPAWTDFVKAAVELKPELGGRNFECPEGIEFVEIDADNGSLATLACPHRELIAVTEKLAPNVECLLHGNLPDSIAVGDGEVADGDRPDEGILAQHAKRSRPVAREDSPTSATAILIEVDARGKHTLTNAMR